jgi:predicted transposase YdaD
MVEDKMVSIAQSLERKGEFRNKIEIAKKMLLKGYEFFEISEITGLSIERIKQLQ